MFYDEKPSLEEFYDICMRGEYEKLRDEDSCLMHYGTPRHSGRYPWGSGDNPYQHSGDWLSRVNELKKSGVSESEIAKQMGIVNEFGKPSSGRLRAYMAIANEERRSLQVAQAKSLKSDGKSLKEIAKAMGFKNDSSVRTLLNEDSERRMNQAQKTVDFLKQQVAEKGMIDVGTGVEKCKGLGVSKEKLNQALYMLQAEGYEVYGAGVPQVTNPGKQTNIRVLCPPGTAHKDIYDYSQVKSIEEYASHDGGDTFDKYQYPKSIDSKRVMIRYAEDGGIGKDGTMEIRRNVPDLSLGESHYAQVRILVDGNRYLKGMALYANDSDMPAGVDIIFNTNKKKGTPKEDVLKTIKDDPDNPFGALIKANGQSYYIDKNGKKQLSAINKTREEGDWSSWSDTLPSQFLSKHPIELIRKQLKLTKADAQAEYDEIMSLTNPTVKKALLKSFADDCDAAAVHLKAAALPRQKYQVILPITSMKDDEVYAPNYSNGETVALIRYPHGGTFEIPILKVNNKQSDAKDILGNAKDAIGINSKVAERLSGADFDGDTVMVIPCNSNKSKVKIVSTDPLEGLVGFDPKLEYGGKTPGTFKQMKNTQTEMGIISNLITDMTLKGAPTDELARAVRHSMVVIDAEKHKLDYKQSYIDNGIAALKKAYQGVTEEDGSYHEGAGTLISRAKSKVLVTKRKGSPRIDPETGKQTWKEVEEYYDDPKTGKKKLRQQESTRMFETDDAYTLTSGPAGTPGLPKERVYAEYANWRKSMANKARKEILAAGKIPYSSSAKSTYAEEVKSLNAKLNVALKNAPRERQAQLLANSIVKAKKEDNPSMTKGDLKKAKQQALTQARNTVGAKRQAITVTDKEWAAIQAGAISESKLTQIMNHVDMDSLKEKAMPRTRKEVTPAKQARIKALNASGYTTSEIAEILGYSSSTIAKYL